MIRRRTVEQVVWICDGPGTWAENHEGMEMDVTDWVDPKPEGWHLAENGIVLCDKCVATATCRRDGHKMTGWFTSPKMTNSLNTCLRMCGYWETAGEAPHVSPHRHVPDLTTEMFEDMAR